jgi:A/G-specific adenine glycosylase
MAANKTRRDHPDFGDGAGGAAMKKPQPERAAAATKPSAARKPKPKQSASALLPDPAAIANALAAWFQQARRDLPWRSGFHAPPTKPPIGEPCRDPWVALMAEAMLQQTQVSRVVEYLARFAARFPTPASMAATPEAEVLAMWSGLGYYRRARNLKRCADEITRHHGGRVPSSLDALLELPGLGRYTAGALASIVFGHAEPIVDGNVARVLLRIGGKPLDPAAKPTIAMLWAQAQQLANTTSSPGLVNEAIMELGALVCTPKAPRCVLCPLSAHCRAAALGKQDQIPPAKVRAARASIELYTAVISDRSGRILLQQRPATGLWAGMWQTPTVELGAGGTLAELLGTNTENVRAVGSFLHQTTHRSVHVSVFTVATSALAAPAAAQLQALVTRIGGSPCLWKYPSEFGELGMSNAAKRAIKLATSPQPPAPGAR